MATQLDQVTQSLRETVLSGVYEPGEAFVNSDAQSRLSGSFVHGR